MPLFTPHGARQVHNQIIHVITEHSVCSVVAELIGGMFVTSGA